MKIDVSSDTIKQLFDNGFEEQIIDIMMLFENTDMWSISDIPISPLLISNNSEGIIISQEIYDVYQMFIKRINNPDTAGEIPFVLLGNRKEINGKKYIFLEKIEYDISDNLSDLSVKYDGVNLENLIKNSSYNIISIGHTHGNVVETEKGSTLTGNLPSSLFEHYQIRDVGLNLSVADINSHRSVINYAKKLNGKEILQTVIMYNGDMIILGGFGISKFSDINALLKSGETISMPTGITINKNSYLPFNR